jgi:hypothetical protein
MPREPALSVVVATTLPWPALRMTMDSVYEQARARDAEVIVGMRESGLPEGAYPEAVRLVEPHGTLLSLRAAAFARARGAVIAMTEDHCRVRPDWCEAVLRVHAARPDALVIIGCVENTARDRWSEWGAYLLGNGAFMAPLESGRYGGAITSANASFKRSGLPEQIPSRGWSGDWHAAWLCERGTPALLDPGPVVDHELALSLRQGFRIFYLSARASAPEHGEGAVVRAVLGALWGIARAPLDAVRTALRVAVRKGRFRAASIASIPTVAALIVAHHLGLACGAIAGPGSAPDLLS